MTSTSHIVGILLAAGRSRRMGTSKQLLPWRVDANSEPTTVVVAAFDALATHCDSVIVVFGHEADRVSHALAGRRFVPVLADPDAEMLESIKQGLRPAMSMHGCEAALIHPADHPCIAASTMQTLFSAAEREPSKAAMPVFAGRGGHPVLVPRVLFDQILVHFGGGLRRFWADHPACCLRIDVDDPWVIRDFDTPGDFQAIARI